MSQAPLAFRAIVLLFVLDAPLFGVATVVTVSGRQLLVSGQPYTVQGVNYSPTPVGTTVGATAASCTGGYQWWADPSTYNSDFPLIRRMGANTIRAYGILNDTSATQQQYVNAMLDAAAANGLYVIMNHYPSHSANPANAGQQAAWQAEFVAGINAYENKEAVLIWEFGNENNLDNGQFGGWYPLVNTIAGAGQAADANHPIMTVEGETSLIAYSVGSAARSANDASMTNLDIWGINAYRGTSFRGLFESVVTSTTKPVLITEFGKDAYLDSSAQENQTLQATHLSAQWQEISSHLSANDVTKPLVGGVVFEWTDEWWKDAGANTCLQHDTTILFSRPLVTEDPGYNDEWFGLAGVSPVNAISNPAGKARSLRAGYTTMQSFWNPSALASASASGSFFSDIVRNYPNPFRLGRESTKFVIQATVAGTVNLSVYDAGGHFVTSFKAEVTPPARTEMFWDGYNGQGQQVSSGLYLVRIEGSGSGKKDTQFRKVVAVK